MTTYIDAHIHLWDVAEMEYPWLASEPSLPRRADLSTYRDATKDDPPTNFIFVQAGAAERDGLHEARWVHDMCAKAPDFAGLVVFGPTAQGADALSQHLDELEIDEVLGVRQLIQWAHPGYCTTPAFKAAVASLAAADLAFDICVLAHQLPEAIELARAAPNTRLVLDHLGKPDIAGGQLSAWRNDLAALAKLENVFCKLSGLATEADHETWTTDDLQPCVDIALSEFGPSRTMWGSDWPVCLNATTHSDWRRATARLLGGLNPSEQAQVRSRTARDAYKLR